MKKKQITAFLLAAVLTATSSPQSLQAAVQSAEQEKVDLPVTKEIDWNKEKKNVSVLDDIKKDKDETQTQQKNEIVTVIVQTEASPMLSLYQQSNNSDFNSFLKKNQTKRNAIQNQVQAVKSAIQNLSQKLGSEAEFLYTYDIVFSGLSVKIPYSELEEVKKIPNVKNAFVASTYQIPKDQTNKNIPAHEMVNSGRKMIKSDKVQNQSDMDYSGEGETIAVIDSGLSYKHEAFTKKPQDQHYDTQNIQELLNEQNFASESDYSTYKGGTLTASDVYMNDKVPYAYDYANHDTDVTPTNTNNHGTHVSGIAAGNSDKIQGVAPEAQLMMLKVFDDNGLSSDASLLAALQDAVLLQPDAINMSLGTDAGFSVDSDEAMQQAYDMIKEAGINLDVAAGNSTTSANNSKLGNDAKVENIDNGIVSNPSTLNAALSVASIENVTVSDATFIKDSQGKKYEYTENATNGKKFTDIGKGQFQYVDCGEGASKDFTNKDLNGKIALIKRGGTDESGNNLYFNNKVKNAADAGAIAVIVYNNVDGVFGMSIDSSYYLIPAIAVKKEVGENLIQQIENGEGTLTFNPDDKSNEESEQANQMSSFSSWGTSPDLGIKPEITAPGGNIYSAYYLNSDGSSAYGNMSGTSMASPHMAGASAVVRQYLKEKHSEFSDKEKESMVNTLMMSTASPIEDKENEKDGQKLYYPVRQQGAGMVNLESVVKTPAYMKVKGSERPKAELGDSKDGSFTFTAEIVNMGDETLTYDLDAAVQIPNYYTDKNTNYLAQNDLAILNKGATVTYGGVDVEGDTVTVKAGDTSAITVQIQLDTENENIIKENEIFKNGFYVEGFLFVKGKNTPDLSVPYLGFYGDWSAASLFDASAYEKDSSPVFQTNTMQTSSVGGNSWSGGTVFTVGQNPLAVLTNDGDQTAKKENMVLSPDSKYINDAIPTTILLRGAKKLEYKVTDENGKMIKDYNFNEVSKSYYLQTMNAVVSAETQVDQSGSIHFNGKDNNGKALPEGEYEFVIEGTKDTPKEQKEAESYKITVDKTEPELKKDKCVIYEKDGKLYVSVAAKDNRGLAGFQLVVSGSSQWGSNQPVSLYKYTDCKKEDMQIFELGSVSELENSGYTLDKMTVVAYDYAMNYSQMEVTKGTEPEMPSAVSEPTKPSDVTPSKGSEKPSVKNPSDVKEPSKGSSEEEPSKGSGSQQPSGSSKNPSEGSKPNDPSEGSGDEPSRGNKPSEPSKTQEPSKGSKPDEPEKPSKPENPSEGSRPNHPSEGSRIEKPSKSSEASKPEKPSKGSEIEKPSKPVKPSGTSRPVQPSNGSEAEKPSQGSGQQKPTEGSKAQETTGIRLTDRKLIMTVGEEKNLMAYELPSGKILTDAIYESSDTQIATVSDSGTIEAKKAGIVLITVMTSDKKFKETCEVKVKEYETKPSEQKEKITGIKLSDEKMKMTVGEDRNLIVIAEPNGSVVKDATFKSSNESIVTVSENGKVTATGEGKALILVKTADEAYSQICSVEVTAGSKPSSSEGSSTPSSSNAPSGKADTKIDEVTGIEVKNVAANAIEVSWGLVSGVSGYEIYRKDNTENEYQLVDTIHGNSQTVYKDEYEIQTGKTYTYKICAFIIKAGDVTRSEDSIEVSAKALIPQTSKIKKVVSQKDGSIKLQFTKVSGASGYEVYRRTGKNGAYKRLCVTTKNSITDNKNIAFGETYYYKIRAYVKNGTKEVYGLDTKAVGVKSSHFGTIKIKSIKKLMSAKLKISWTKAPGAKKYEIYRSTTKNGAYKKVKVLKGQNAISYVDKVARKRKYFYKVRPVGNIGNYIVKGNFSTVKSKKTR